MSGRGWGGVNGRDIITLGCYCFFFYMGRELSLVVLDDGMEKFFSFHVFPRRPAGGKMTEALLGHLLATALERTKCGATANQACPDAPLRPRMATRSLETAEGKGHGGSQTGPWGFRKVP